MTRANDFWGPSFWTMIHIGALDYNTNFKHSYRSFILSLEHLLPCEFCRAHLMQNLHRLPLNTHILENKIRLFKWTYILHDIVNKQLGKESIELKDAIEMYRKVIVNKTWENDFWVMLHSVATTYSPTPVGVASARQFVESLPGIVPCVEFKEILTKALAQRPLFARCLESRESFFLWTYWLHDVMNRHYKKTSPTFDKVKTYYFGILDCTQCKITRT